MEFKPLPQPAEDVRRGIVDMIPETTTLSDQPTDTLATLLEEDDNGTKTYGGDRLAGQIHQLISKMEIGTGWKWRLIYWSKRLELLNDRKQGYLLPLSEKILISPGGTLYAGFYVYLTNEPILSSGAAAILIVPK
ncbi:hypothetical protein N7478_003737 [Penicillium angulare]|uniref:uncharacterized protein n=1 Tax=Penicillium angulare TaxID=116970 RepID=UPI00253F7620|nr:uncharacterized protein N7478_003737 [Penicillium angulare]KAJ5288051.1 hypothetical protein N7478_003737 [Penicillium angulare]